MPVPVVLTARSKTKPKPRYRSRYRCMQVYMYDRGSRCVMPIHRIPIHHGAFLASFSVALT